jgi:arylsulfatase A-like enzyme
MKSIMIMYDSLNKHMLSAYGCDWTKTPNFQRLSEKSVTFEKMYVGSMPCMPARRELHTGRYNFLHRSWGPFEPFDDSTPEILHNSGIYTHLVSDHYHYWEDGGATYHHRYSSWENVRGQEGDRWKGEVTDPILPEHLGRVERQDWINRKYMHDEELTPQAQTFARGIEFIKKNRRADNWSLQIETFDPHEPYFTLNQWKGHYPHKWDGPHFDWPKNQRVEENPEAVRHLKYEYASLLTQCDHYLGLVLDLMDEYGLWEDTMLIVNTDHGFLLGEHDWWAKCRMPFYNEIANIPLFIWDPRSKKAGKRRSSLTQTIDVGPTLLDYFNIKKPKDMQGHSLRSVIESDEPVREVALYGIFGGHVNITDGRYVYMRAPNEENEPLFHYTHMPSHMNSLFSTDELKMMQWHQGFNFTKGCPVMKIPSKGGKGLRNFEDLKTKLFDLEKDPGQKNQIKDETVENCFIEKLISMMKATDAPQEQYTRLGLNI